MDQRGRRPVRRMVERRRRRRERKLKRVRDLAVVADVATE